MYQNNLILQLLYKNYYYIGQVFKLFKMYYCSVVVWNGQRYTWILQ